MTSRKALEPLQETIQAAGPDPPAVGRVRPGAVRVRAFRVRLFRVRVLRARIAAVRAVRGLTAGPVRGGLPGRGSRRLVRRGRVRPG